MPDTPLDLDAIQARADAATEGPWERAITENRKWALVLAHGGTDDEERLARLADDDDAEFVAHARTDVPALVAEVRTLRAEREAWREYGWLNLLDGPQDVIPADSRAKANEYAQALSDAGGPSAVRTRIRTPWTPIERKEPR